ncbi:MAG: FtsX-like permease family protein [Cyclobacteriaceae bacterium]
MGGRPRIPRLPQYFFRWYCRRELYEELHGDLEEFFYERVEEKGLRRAQWMYWLDVIKCCQPYAWKDLESQNSEIIMLKNYLKTTYRSMRKRPLTSAINILGLSFAIAICLVPYAFVDQDLSIDQFHENKDNIFLATYHADRDGDVRYYGNSPTPLAEALAADYAQVVEACRVQDRQVVMKNGDRVFHEEVRYVDPSFLKMMTFPLKWGQPSALQDVNSIILSEDMAVKYFGETNPIGSNVTVIFDSNNTKTFAVAGVANELPKAHAISFDFLINFENYKISDPAYDLNDWTGLVDATLVQVKSPEDISVISESMEKYRILQNSVVEERPIAEFSFEQLTTLHERSRYINNDISFGSREEGWVILSVLGLFILILACFNYVNIAIVSASTRLKEIATRKVMGANRRGVITQFLAENMILTLMALVIGVLLGSQVVLPWFNELFSENLELRLLDPQLWLFFISMALFTGLVAGLYPALYIARFDVIGIFRGSVKFGRKNKLTKVLLCVQLVLACITIANAVYITQNNAFQLSRPWGYDPTNVLYVGVNDQPAYDQMRFAVAQNPNVLQVAGSSQHLGTDSKTVMLHLPDRQYEVSEIAVEANYFELLGIQLTEGRLFQENYESDDQKVVVNQLLVNRLEIEDPIGRTFKVDDIRYEVVGVVSDFHFDDFDSNMVPTVFKVAEPEDYRYLALKVREGTTHETHDFLQAQWLAIAPELPFRGGFQEDVFDGYYEYMASGSKFMRAVGFIGILLAGLGLYGLVTLNVSGRVKEFSIRKVLGARVSSVAAQISKQYAWLCVVSLIIGLPLSYYWCSLLLETFFVYHMPMNLSGAFIAMFILVSVLVGVLAIQVRKVAKSNPVNGLRAE